MTAAPGWYPDPADPRCLRWWNGTGWTDRVGPPAFQPTPAQRPLLGKDQGVENPFVWLIACLPFGLGALMLSWSVEVRPYINSSGYASIDPGYVFSTTYFLILIALAVTYCATVLLAAFDYRWLARRGVVRPFPWAWSFLGGVPYVIGRAVILHKVGPRRGRWPIAVIVAAWGLYLVAGALKSLSFMQAVFSELGYPT
ncbi:DUF2510 domain-containing protein [Paenarthrobacter nicotinovorans]|uniref:DUF2510 domain-containing protein n=1 Tax=Paenarthrobacter nicotinovorans TaxID=29320 RepID=UPI00166C4D92|nr:DUF2510 domain-containing protein [Paenarthrobacter nicotinovorans]UKE98278.1 DUF2510 domain-containing protein [Paenarthrobacter nicotinovorans]UKF03065.1 DUF2510 domain-containing protein [Paenarthrobacter nicotinovorans]